ncbi:DUF397 domain-containing protein [Actinomadura opuntiae]|uniref:DUF397 domain-containing protein n=1 Tax=Actinomadura sp. OS1-43 TaxID=604315 RepID=UPI00255AFA6C|nr:DUF397 domain-containing protein [Actinomadura sp. OS1-43]MDL4813081.1 DUF397 domain-containing protein [Actinomadura sp. OS1-43]
MSLHADLSKARWRKASQSSASGSDCIEVASLPGLIAVRDSKNPDGPKLLLTRSAFRTLAAQASARPLGH